jgi:hypothetical protein
MSLLRKIIKFKKSDVTEPIDINLVWEQDYDGTHEVGAYEC